jgi:hypothetical protein
MTGGGIVIKESDEVGGIVLMICTITVTRNPAARDERPVPALPRPLVHRRGDGSAFVGTVVTAAAENSLPATPIDPFPEPAW